MDIIKNLFPGFIVLFVFPPMFLCLFFTILLARQVEIKPLGTFEFYDIVQENDIYKFKYNTQGDVEISLYDPSSRLIFTDTVRSAAFFANMRTGGKAKIVVKNRSKHPVEFSYKSPDPNKELLGHLGYIKDVDMVGELARYLDQLLIEQDKQLKRTKLHQEMVSKTRFWARILIFSEVVLTAVAVYIIYKDFIAMFERKEAL